MSNHNVSLPVKSESQIGALMLHISLITILCIAFYPVFQGLISTWSHSDEYSHGFIILPISLYIVWKKRQKLVKEVEIKTTWLYFIPFIFVLFVYTMSSMARIATVAALSFPLTLVGLILFLYGPKVLKQTIFPVSFLFLMIPVPEQIYTSITIHLQLMVSKISVFCAAAVGVPIFREGNVIHLPGRTLQVVQACSGIRSLISLLTVCLTIAYLGLKNNRLRTILSIAAVPAAVMANVIRVLAMILALYFFNLDLTAESVHSSFGLAILAIAIILILLIWAGLAQWEKHIIKK